MSTDKEPGIATRGALRLAPNCDEVEEQQAKLPRQFVNFTFYHARPEWRSLTEADKQRTKEEFVNAVNEFRPQLMIHTYSTIGLRTNVDFMIWRIGSELDPIQEMIRGQSHQMAKFSSRRNRFFDDKASNGYRQDNPKMWKTG